MTAEPNGDTNGDSTDNEYGVFRLNRRELMQAGASAAGVFGLSSVASADDHLDEQPIELRATKGSHIGRYASDDGIVEITGLTDAIDDWRAGDLDIQTLVDIINLWRNEREADTTLGPDERAWMGHAPSNITGTANPALPLTAGTEYTLELSSDIDESITFVITDADGTVVQTADTLSGSGTSRTITFTATESMAMYYAEEYPEEMRGQISTDTGEPRESRSLWYRQPAQEWETEALPIGNGRMGAMVFGKTSNETIQINEETVWADEGADHTNPEAGEYLGEIQQLLLDSEHQEAASLASDTSRTSSGDISSACPGGS